MPLTAASTLPTVPDAPPIQPTSDIKILIGQVTGACAGAIAQGVTEWRAGGVQSTTKVSVADLVTQLFLLKQATVGEIDDFLAVARKEGRQAMRDNCGPEVPDGMIDELINGVIEILANVMKARIN